MMAAVLGRPDDAQALFTVALAAERALDAPPLVARTCYWFGTHLLARGPDHAGRACQLLDEAGAIAGRLGMTGLAAQVAAAR